jgi:hypothetical protein
MLKKKLSLSEVVEVERVVRHRGSHIFLDNRLTDDGYLRKEKQMKEKPWQLTDLPLQEFLCPVHKIPSAKFSLSQDVQLKGSAPPSVTCHLIKSAFNALV